MPQLLLFVVFTLDEQRYALPLASVERVVRAVAVTALPKAPAIVLGAINVQGEIIPVINVRRLNHLPQRALQDEDEFIIALETSDGENPRRVALWVDSVQGVLECSDSEVLPASQIFAGVEYVSGAIRGREGITLVQDLAQSLSAHDVAALDEIISQQAPDTARVLEGVGESA
jgi:purine-binding chemotaxis protein CheW